MVQLPVWELGFVIFIPMATACALRCPLEKKLVLRKPPIKRSLAQFRLDLALFFTAGMGMALILLIGYHFPLLQSGMKLVLGIFTVGMFASIDLALARERLVIQAALSGEATFAPPRQLSPLTRKFSLVATLILVLITAIILLVLIRDIHWLASQDLTMESIDLLGRSVLLEILFVMGFLLLMVINLVFSYARNLRILFDNETVVLENVSQGDLTRKVPVITNDELGFIAGHTNTMISSLREGVRMREGLLVAQEVQQHFLPASAPVVPGLDIAGTARFSDETGGDFYDFVDCELNECGTIGIVVGDVSGHGIGAALLMAAGRSLVRQSATLGGSPARNITTANRSLARDIDGSGRFITLFFMTINPLGETATWVNAGHQPPLLYADDTFTELRGSDIPLGVEETWEFHEQQMALPGPGQILLIGTDGAWEAHNAHGEMFGDQRIRSVIRDNCDRNAEEILEAIINAVREFCGETAQEDDITMVVIKGVDE